MSNNQWHFSLTALNIPRFDGSQYKLWRLKMMRVLEYMGIWHLTMQERPIRDATWVEAERDAGFLLLQYTTDKIFQTLNETSTTKEIFDSLDATYGTRKSEDQQQPTDSSNLHWLMPEPKPKFHCPTSQVQKSIQMESILKHRTPISTGNVTQLSSIMCFNCKRMGHTLSECVHYS